MRGEGGREGGRSFEGGQEGSGKEERERKGELHTGMHAYT
jgi:hypothetical protein